MSAAMARARAHEQGYLDASEKPACANCFALNTRTGECALGSFEVKPDGWCPVWVPTIEWGDRNLTALHKLGLSMGDNLKQPDAGLQMEGA